MNPSLFSNPWLASIIWGIRLKFVLCLFDICLIIWLTMSCKHVGLLPGVGPLKFTICFYKYCQGFCLKDKVTSKQVRNVKEKIKGIHHYHTLHRLSVQIEVPSRGSISKKRLVCLYKFDLDRFFFRRVFSTIYLKMRWFFASTFFDIYWFLKTAILHYHDSLIAPIRLVCSLAIQIFKK